ncbi:MAG: ATP-dependent Clp protease proteolytic subunit [Terricaulis sp.]
MIEKALFDARVVMLTGEVNDQQARRVTERLLALAAQNSNPITFVISSPGGHVESGDMIHDVIKFVGAPVKMLGTGWVASAGALIYCAVPLAQRFCLPNTRFLLHEPRGGIGGMASDVEIQAREILRMRERLNKIFADATGQPIDKINATSTAIIGCSRKKRRRMGWSVRWFRISAIWVEPTHLSPDSPQGEVRGPINSNRRDYGSRTAGFAVIREWVCLLALRAGRA